MARKYVDFLTLTCIQQRRVLVATAASFTVLLVSFLPVSTLLEHSKISFSPAVMQESLSLVFISSAAVSAEIHTAALSCQYHKDNYLWLCQQNTVLCVANSRCFI